jgi:hypothetical protein
MYSWRENTLTHLGAAIEKAFSSYCRILHVLLVPHHMCSGWEIKKLGFGNVF